MPQQIFATNSLGGNLATTKLTKMLRHRSQPRTRFRQFVEVKERWGAKKGTTLLIPKQGNLSTSFSRSLAETATVPQESLTYGQASVVIQERGTSVAYTEFLDLVAEYDVPEALDRALNNDMVKDLDGVVATVAKATELIAVCNQTNSTVFTSNGTATATASVQLSGPNVKDIVDYMKQRNIPPYDNNGNYICIGSVGALRGVRDSMETVGQYAAFTAEDFAKGTFFKPFNGEVGRYYGVRFIETNHATALSESVGASSNKGQAIFLGADALYEVIGRPEEVREGVPADLGRDRRLGWIITAGWARPWNFTNDVDQRIVFVTSA